ncbi:leucine-rich repeat protein [Photobacterium nomapromontoriensis]|uniref:leucine-rich repeat protein n=1 Tax=Photobacterium nomapromontoriensis TaxID=2910237 RepID=UPI003D0C100A
MKVPKLIYCLITIISFTATVCKAGQATVLTLNDVKFVKNTGSIIDYRSKYKDIIIPETFDGVPVKSISEYAFYKNGLTSVTLPNSVDYIGPSAFYGNALTKMTLPSSLRAYESPHNFFDKQ